MPGEEPTGTVLVGVEDGWRGESFGAGRMELSTTDMLTFK